MGGGRTARYSDRKVYYLIGDGQQPEVMLAVEQSAAFNAQSTAGTKAWRGQRAIGEVSDALCLS